MASPLKMWLEQSLDSSRHDLEQSLGHRASSYGGLEPPCHLLKGQDVGMQLTGISGRSDFHSRTWTKDLPSLYFPEEFVMVS